MPGLQRPDTRCFALMRQDSDDGPSRGKGEKLYQAIPAITAQDAERRHIEIVKYEHAERR